MIRQNPPLVRAERYEVRLVVDLQMRQLPVIKRLRHTMIM
jgi:hypothetical protein